MDYEKKYKDAIKYLRAFIDGDCVTDSEILADFPELRESEEPLEFLKGQAIEMIASIEHDISQSVYDGIKGHSPEDERELERWKKALAWLEKQKEPHYTKRNALFDKCVENCDPKVMKEVSDRVDEMLQKEQKPAEWSEEDENTLKYLHELISFGYTEKFFDAQTAAGMREWLNARLKSLRPQPHTVSIKNATKFGNLEYERGVKDGIQSEKSRQWKPSEEQMEALKDAVELYKVKHIEEYHYRIESLYEQLKKLI